MKFLRICSLVALTILLQACAISMKVPISRFETPETTGQIGRFRFGMGYGTAARTTFTSDYGYASPTTIDPFVDSVQAIGFFNAQAGVLRWLDLEYKAYNYFQAKVQFLGLPEPEATEGMWSGAVTAAFGYEDEDESSREFGGSQTANYQLSQHKTDAALIVGYRIDEIFLVYGGPYMKWIEFDGSSKTYAASTATPFAGKNRLMGANAGLRIGHLDRETFIGVNVFFELGIFQFNVGSTQRTGGSIGTAMELSL